MPLAVSDEAFNKLRGACLKRIARANKRGDQAKAQELEGKLAKLEALRAQRAGSATPDPTP